jgi:hypothetical protein
MLRDGPKGHLPLLRRAGLYLILAFHGLRLDALFIAADSARILPETTVFPEE